MKPGTVFYKMSGSGNDFVMFDGRHTTAEELTREAIVALCDRRLGVGADGVGLLEPPPPEGDGVDFRFRFWNRDGSVGPMCGNGALCATRLAVILEFASPDAEIRFSTPAGLHRGRVVGTRSEIALPDCPAPTAAPEVRTLPGEGCPTLVRPSVPHLVLTVDDVETVAVADRGPALRSDPATGDGGANVNWMSPRGDGSWKMRTFERGVEGETLACGTGAVACALTLASQGLASSPARLWTRSGLPLDVAFDAGPSTASSIRLTGEGRLVFRGLSGSLPTDCPTDG
ncbi:MAG TPA: diaminopimelate epimerase [Gemmatimonadales bacterium]|nr:diaminopimelate epimerase [Gemmatimonadales bacterium]